MSRLLLIRCLLFVGTLLMSTTYCDAGLLDWLFPLRAQRVAARRAQRTEAYRPVTSYYGGTGTWNGWTQTAQAQSSWYKPTTAYRTVWQPVPVTSYSVGSNGCQSPCTKYEWQARRVPYLTYQPLTPTVAPTAAAVAPDCGCNSTVGSASGWQTVGSTAAYQPATCAPTSYAAAATSSPAASQYTPGFGYQNGAEFSTPAANMAPTLPANTATDGWSAINSNSTTGSGCSDCNGGTTTNYAPPSDGYAASEWQPVNSQSAPTTDYRATHYGSTQDTQTAAGATEWRPVNSSPPTEAKPDSKLNPVPADRAPQLENSNDGASNPYRRQLAGNNTDWQPVSSQAKFLPANAYRDSQRDDSSVEPRNEANRRQVPVNRPSDFQRSDDSRDRLAIRRNPLDNGFATAKRYPADQWQTPNRRTTTTYQPRDLAPKSSDWSYDEGQRRQPSYDWRSTENSPSLGRRPVEPLIRQVPDSDRDRPWLEASASSSRRPQRTAARVSYDRWQAKPIQAKSDSGWVSAHK